MRAGNEGWHIFGDDVGLSWPLAPRRARVTLVELVWSAVAKWHQALTKNALGRLHHDRHTASSNGTSEADHRTDATPTNT